MVRFDLHSIKLPVYSKCKSVVLMMLLLVVAGAQLIAADHLPITYIQLNTKPIHKL